METLKTKMQQLGKNNAAAPAHPGKKALKKQEIGSGSRRIARPDRPAGYPAHTAPYTMKTGPIEVFLDAESDF